jgi:hypothetical protein
MFEGYGVFKNGNGDEYSGMWKEGRSWGEGIFKNGATGRIVKGIWDGDKLVKLIEVIKE